MGVFSEMIPRSKGRVLFLGVLVFTLIVAGCQIFPSYAPFNVRVTVIDKTGQGVDGATVILRGPDSERTAQTNNGVAVIQGVVPNNYRLIVTAPDGAGVSYDLPLWGGRDHNIEIKFDDPDKHLVAKWSFEEESGNIVEDSSPNNHFGEIFGDVTRTDGISGRGLRFDGGYVYVKNSNDFNLDAFTISVWAKIDDPKQDQKLIGRTPIGSGFIVGFQNEGLRPEVWTPSYYDFEAGKIQANQWTHLVVTFQAGVGMTGYVNGEKVAHVSIPGTMAKNNRHLVLGANSWDYGHKFKGIMDEVYVFDRVLSIDEIKALGQIPH